MHAHAAATLHHGDLLLESCLEAQKTHCDSCSSSLNSNTTMSRGAPYPMYEAPLQRGFMAQTESCMPDAFVHITKVLRSFDVGVATLTCIFTANGGTTQSPSG